MGDIGSPTTDHTLPQERFELETSGLRRSATHSTAMSTETKRPVLRAPYTLS